MQYLLKQPTTKNYLLNFLQQSQEKRIAELVPFKSDVNPWTSPVTIKSGLPTLYHVDRVLADLKEATNLEDLPDDTIMFFPNYSLLHAAHNIARNNLNKADIKELVFTALAHYGFGNSLLSIVSNDRKAVLPFSNWPKGTNLLAYNHWRPKGIPMTTDMVTSGFYPYQGSEPRWEITPTQPQQATATPATPTVTLTPKDINYPNVDKFFSYIGTQAKVNEPAFHKYLKGQVLDSREAADLHTYSLWPMDIKKALWKGTAYEYRASPAFVSGRVTSDSLAILWQKAQQGALSQDELTNLCMTFHAAGLLYAFMMYGNHTISALTQLHSKDLWGKIREGTISTNGWKIPQLQLATASTDSKLARLKKWADHILATGRDKSPYKTGLTYLDTLVVKKPKFYALSPVYPYIG